MDFYQKNLAALKELDPELVDKLAADNVESDNIKVLESPLGHKVMYIKNNEGNYIQLNSMYDPFNEASELCNEIKEGDFTRRLIISIGIGMGYHLKEVSKRINKKSIVLVVERDISVFKKFLDNIDFSEEIESNNFIFFVGDIEDVRGPLKNTIVQLTYNLKNINIITLPIIDIDYIRYCKSISSIVNSQRANHIFNMGNDTEDTLIGIKNNFKNLHEHLWNCGIAELLELYNNEYKGKPAIVVATGPSLNKNIHLLKDIQDKALILACDASLKPLLENGVEPDAVLSVERVMITYDKFYKGKTMPKDTVIIAPPIVRPEILDSFEDNRKVISFKRGEGIHEWMASAIDDKGLIPTGSSVAHLCFSVASVLGADPIILIGQDLAYSPEGYSHGSGAEVLEKVDLNNKNIVYVKDYNGNDIPSTQVWKNFLTQLEDYISKSESETIDATEGGALIEGTKIMILQDVVKKYCNEELVPLYKIVEKYKSDLNKVKENYEKIIKLTEKEIRWYELMKLRSEKSKKLIQGIIDNENNIKETEEELDRLFDIIMYVEKKVAKKMKGRATFLMFFQTLLRETAFAISDLGQETKEINIDTLIKNIKVQKTFLIATIDISEQVINTLKEVLEIARNDLKNLK